MINHLVRSCFRCNGTPKKKYSTFEEAVVAVQNDKSLGEVYKCDLHGFHIGHKNTKTNIKISKYTKPWKSG